MMSLRKNFIWTLFGNFSYGFAQWGILIITAKFCTPEVVGRFSLALAVTAPVIMFANLNLRGVLATDATRRYHFRDYLTLRLIMLSAALLVITAITTAAGYEIELAAVILIVGLAKVFESLSDVFYGLQQQSERMDRISISLTIKAIASLLAFGTGVYISNGILWGVINLALTWVGLLFLIDIPSAARTSDQHGLWPQWNPSNLKTLTWLALPLGIATLLNSLLTNIPRYFIAWNLGERELGIFSAMAYVMIIGARVVTSLGQAATPRLASFHAQRNKTSFKRLLLQLVGIGGLIAIIGILLTLLAGRQILSIIYKPEYSENLPAFAWIMIAAGIDYMGLFLQFGMMAAHQFRVQPIIIGITLISLLAACTLLIPTYGITGASMALAISSTTQFLGNAYITIFYLKKLDTTS